LDFDKTQSKDFDKTQSNNRATSENTSLFLTRVKGLPEQFVCNNTTTVVEINLFEEKHKPDITIIQSTLYTK